MIIRPWRQSEWKLGRAGRRLETLLLTQTQLFHPRSDCREENALVLAKDLMRLFGIASPASLPPSLVTDFSGIGGHVKEKHFTSSSPTWGAKALLFAFLSSASAVSSH